jgi:predicted ATPase/serine/threonine protein kinase
VALTRGTRLGPYEIIDAIAAGGMGEVYRAHDERLGRDVALKILSPSVAANQSLVIRFAREARAASALNHPNIVVVHDVCHHDPLPYITMELIEGHSLRQLLDRGPMPLAQLLAIAVQVSDVLTAAHGRGIVHRDLKPENVMVTSSGLVKVLDFGLAKFDLQGAGEQTAAAAIPTEAGTLLGTVHYMSPEQARGESVDFRSDQFSFGTMLYEMVAGRRPFRQPSSVETLAAIIRQQAEPLSAVSPQVPPPLEWIVTRCLAKDPGDRYASTADLHRDLITVRNHLSAGAASEAANRRPSSIPAPRTSLIGRERELETLDRLLRVQKVRLTTLTGPGGVGKTRLALQLGLNLAETFTGGVWFVPLAGVPDSTGVPAAVAQTLLTSPQRDSTPFDAVKRMLAATRQPTLLLLDNFEHLLPGATMIAELLETARGLQILVTSRAVLHVYGEYEFPVAPLSVPRRDSGDTRETVSRSPAVALFLERAAAARPGVAVAGEENTIAEICRRLDGLPMAIELAAARVKLLPPAAILARLEHRLQLLTGGARDLPMRQQTLRAAIDWSYGLLSEAEQRLFRRLAVFVNGCTLEAAEAVADAFGDLGVDVLEGVAALVDQSLLERWEHSAPEPRIAMLETIREYGLDRLAAAGEGPLARRAHAAYFLVLAEEAHGNDPAAQSVWLAACEVDFANIRAALEWLTRSREVEWGFRLSTALLPFWETREHLGAARELLMALLELPEAAAPTRLRAQAAFAAGTLANSQRDGAAALKLHRESLDIYQQLGDRRGVAVSLNALGLILRQQGDMGDARAMLEQALDLWRELNDAPAVARAQANLAAVAQAQEDYQTSRELHVQARAMFKSMGDTLAVAWSRHREGEILRLIGDVAAARQALNEALAEFRRLHDQLGIGSALTELGMAAEAAGDIPAMRAHYAEALRTFDAAEYRRGIARVLEAFAVCAAREQNPRRALRLAGAAAAIRQAVGAPSSPVERRRLDAALEQARALEDSTLSWMEGWALSREKAISEAIEVEVG